MADPGSASRRERFVSCPGPGVSSRGRSGAPAAPGAQGKFKTQRTTPKRLPCNARADGMRFCWCHAASRVSGQAPVGSGFYSLLYVAAVQPPCFCLPGRRNLAPLFAPAPVQSLRRPAASLQPLSEGIAGHKQPLAVPDGREVGAVEEFVYFVAAARVDFLDVCGSKKEGQAFPGNLGHVLHLQRFL